MQARTRTRTRPHHLQAHTRPLPTWPVGPLLHALQIVSPEGWAIGSAVVDGVWFHLLHDLPERSLKLSGSPLPLALQLVILAAAPFPLLQQAEVEVRARGSTVPSSHHLELVVRLCGYVRLCSLSALAGSCKSSARWLTPLEGSHCVACLPGCFLPGETRRRGRRHGGRTVQPSQVHGSALPHPPAPVTIPPQPNTNLQPCSSPEPRLSHSRKRQWDWGSGGR